MAFAVEDAPTPNTVNSSVARTREYLTGKEVEKLMEAARKSSRYGHRDATMILIAYRHGLAGFAGVRSQVAPTKLCFIIDGERPWPAGAITFSCLGGVLGPIPEFSVSIGAAMSTHTSAN
jgi:hypothetical protein